MPMKLSLALGKKGPISRQTAWGCLTTNLAVPGIGSLLAGRIVGYFQLAVYGAGFAVSMYFGVQTLYWYQQNYSRLTQQDDPSGSLFEMWVHVKWPLVGVALCALAILWGFISSCGIMAQAKAEENLQKAMAPLPPPKIRM